MKLENQVCSLELAKKLKELGCKQESLWWWATKFNKPSSNAPILLFNKKDITHYKKGYAAYTVAELGEMLPSKITKDGINYFLEQRYYDYEGTFDLIYKQGKK